MNKSLLLLSTALLALTGLTACSKKGDQAIAQLQKTYPLTNCPVSGAKLGEMGKAVDYLYQHQAADGKTNTELVRFCCSGCIAKFNSSPDKYLEQIHSAVK